MTWYRKAADQHNASAQSALGFMYAVGHGVERDDAVAMAWYRRAASQGDTSAQAALGFMYYDGQGIPKNNVVAHMWFNLAAAGGNRVAARKRDAIEERMTLAQIAEAQRLAREWKPTSTPR
jgi:TPR repeat protein